ncbi:Cysteine dioxygenase [Homalodisca vitripennis]|nr:Cysteine dioxygenase [Homalodisca vitripennis]
MALNRGPRQEEIVGKDVRREDFVGDMGEIKRAISSLKRKDSKIRTLQELIAELHKVFESDHVNIEHVHALMVAYQSNPSEWRKYARFDRYRYTRNLVDEGNGKFNLMILCWGEGHGSAIHDHANAHCFMKMLEGELSEIRFDWPKEGMSEQTSMVEISRSTLHKNEIAQGGVASVVRQFVCLNEQALVTAVVRLQYSTSYPMLLYAVQMSVVYVPYYEPSPDQSVLASVLRPRLKYSTALRMNSLGLHRVENPSHSDVSVSLHLYCPPFQSCSVFNQQTGQRSKAQVTFWSLFGHRKSKKSEDEEEREPEDN